MPKPDAIENNERLFRHYLEKLSQIDDQSLFTSTVTSFIQWANNPRAYYAIARPRIVDIALAAAGAIHRALNQPQNTLFHISQCPPNLQRIAESYASLVRTISTHKARFPEEHLQVQIQYLERTVVPLPIATSPTMSTMSPSVMDQAHFPPVASSSDGSPPILPRPASTASSVSRPPSAPRLSSSEVSASRPPSVPRPSSTDSSVQRPTTADSSAPPAKKRKVALKKKSFLEADVAHWKEKRKANKEPHAAETVDNEEEEETKPSVEPNIVTASVPAINKEPTPPADVVMADNTTDDAAVDDAEVDDFLQKVTPSSSDRDRSKSVPVSESHISELGPSVSQPRSPSPTMTNAMSVEPATNSGESNDQVCNSSDNHSNEVSQGPTQDSQQLAMFGPPVGTNAEPIAEHPEPAAEHPEPIVEHITPTKSPSPPPAPKANEVVTEQPNRELVVPPPEDTEIRPPSPQVDETQETEQPPDHYDGKPVVIGLLSASKVPQMHTLDFNLSQTHLDLLSKWRQRHKTDDDVTFSLCLSLAVYSLPNCMAQVEQNPTASLESVLDGAPIPWPTQGQVQAQLNDGGWQALYPPYFVTKDHLVDFGWQTRSGQNTFKLYHAKNFENYVFVLRLHPPTAAQLAELQEWHDSQVAWRKSLTPYRTFSLPRLEYTINVPDVKTRSF